MSTHANSLIYCSLTLLILFTAACNVDSGTTQTDEGSYKLSSSENPEESSPPQFVAPDSSELTSAAGEDAIQDEVHEQDLATRIKVTDDSLTAAVVVGDVVSARSFLFEDEHNITPTGEARGPRFMIYTRVTIDVHTSYRQSMLGRKVFWYRGGVLDEEDIVDEKPTGEYLSGGAKVESGDKIIACIQSNKLLPNGDHALRLRGHQWGITYMNNDSDYDIAMLRDVNEHLKNSHIAFGQN